ncbi:hypothetical protein [Desulfitibacter alkalitolerans]|uniref:hypothetical protein n=1 Tax=Desulfitibacter alkalitolerans TaxID=264641 RepID=UPI00047F5522|nr:hypothetical protein [Desulfitibacter alkalitolerans]
MLETRFRKITHSHSFLTLCLVLFLYINLVAAQAGIGDAAEELSAVEKSTHGENWNFIDNIPTKDIQNLNKLIPKSYVPWETIVNEEEKSRRQGVGEPGEQGPAGIVDARVNESREQQTEIRQEQEQEQTKEQKPEQKFEQRPEQKPEQKQEKPAKNLDGYLNAYVLDVIKNYEIGKYPYLLNNDYKNYNGVTTNLYYKDKLLLKAHPSGNRASHCTGITFEVFFKAMQERNKRLGLDPNDFNGMSWNELFDFVLLWYMADGAQKSNSVIAVEKYGIGKGVKNLEEVRPGDFIQFSRTNNTGHIGVFLEWVREDSRIIGFRYWSSQESTRGINYRTEYFNITDKAGRKRGSVLTNHLYIARIVPVNQYK